MMFDKYCVDEILKGRKTVTRRLVGKRKPAKVGAIHKLKIDRTRTVYGYIKIKDIRQEPLWIVNDSEAKKEGFDSAYDYLKYFMKINGVEDLKTNVWRVEFECIGNFKYNGSHWELS